MGKLSDMWKDGESSEGPDIRHVIWDPETGEPDGDLEGDPDLIINHRLADENGDPVEPEADR